jgi:acetyl esterase/lipase
MTVLPCVYLGFAALVVLSGLAALVRIPGSGGKRGLLQFAVSAPAVHAAPLLMSTLVVASGVAVALGAHATRCGQIGLAASAIAMVFLLWLERRAGATATTLEFALRQAFGAAFRERISPDRSAMRATTPSRINPRNVLPANVERIENLSYGEAGERHLLDIYRPRDPGSDLPVLLAIHGGAWVMGHKAMQSMAILGRMASSGWLVIAINYRLGPRSRFPDPLVDVKRAIAWIRAEAGRYGGDPEFVIACGESAGGHLAALAALTANRQEYQPGFERIDTSLRGAIPIYARLDFTDRFEVANSPDLREFLGDNVMPCGYEQDPGLWNEASPIARVHPDMPPLFVVHGTHDSVVPVEEAEHFVRVARVVARAPVAFARLRGAQHAYDLANSRWTHPTVEAIFAFGELLFAEYRAARDRSASGPGGREFEGPR